MGELDIVGRPPLFIHHGDKDISQEEGSLLIRNRSKLHVADRKGRPLSEVVEG